MDFTSTLLQWYHDHGRHHLPWQTTSWYDRLVSEVMLQQTQVATVLRYFDAFKARFPTPQALADASLDEVYACWQGLGYYRRAKHLQAAVAEIVRTYPDGQCPPNAKAWAALPGIGMSTAGAISSFITGERAVMMDGNAQRVLARYFAIEGAKDTQAFQRAIWDQAQTLLPQESQMPDYTQALMDMGALICKRNPNCEACPLQAGCQGWAQSRPTDFPQPAKKRARPTRYAWVVIPVSRLGVGLTKVQSRGVWEGLWVPAMAQTDSAQQAQQEPALAWLTPQAVRWHAGSVTHDFSHYRLIMYPVIVGLPDEVPLEDATHPLVWKRWQALGEIGLPAPMVTLLDSAHRLAMTL